MTKNKLFAWAITLLCFSLTSCSDEKDGPSKKILVTNAGVTEANQTVKPGDIVHIYGDGFQEGDQVDFDFRWDLGEPLFPEGYLGPVGAEIVERHSNGMSIRMPYRKPESRVEIFLNRASERMSLGKVLLADGQTPKDFRLYGINETDKTIERAYAEETVIGKALNKGDLAIKFIMPQDMDYATEKQKEHISDYLLIDYHHVYSNDNNNVNMNYAYTNVTGNYKDDGTNENQFRYYYPSLNKHNSSNYYVANASKQRNGNLNATFIMRMAEVYLIAAEADIYLNGGANAAGYINKVRERAGANPLTGSITVRDILDERGRELCGEYCRFYDLKRTGMFKNSEYLENTHPDLARFFHPNYALRPISTTFTATITNGSEYQNPGY